MKYISALGLLPFPFLHGIILHPKLKICFLNINICIVGLFEKIWKFFFSIFHNYCFMGNYKNN